MGGILNPQRVKFEFAGSLAVKFEQVNGRRANDNF